MKYVYKPQGVCSKAITLELNDGIVSEVTFTGGCSGNTQGIAMLAKGRRAEEIISQLKNIKCGFKETSCPDQLAIALEEALTKAGSEDQPEAPAE